mmetsp:Transcript_57675/g.137199  ORF Transcript_57675/g.137199 Transcript_57675/m.137199 type:complete len:207 (-) Transcript_57675:136-756(-)
MVHFPQHRRIVWAVLLVLVQVEVDEDQFVPISHSLYGPEHCSDDLLLIWITLADFRHREPLHFVPTVFWHHVYLQHGVHRHHDVLELIRERANASIASLHDEVCAVRQIQTDLRHAVIVAWGPGLAGRVRQDARLLVVAISRPQRSHGLQAHRCGEEPCQQQRLQGSSSATHRRRQQASHDVRSCHCRYEARKKRHKAKGSRATWL